MTPVVGISSIMFHGYNDDLGTLDNLINGVEKLRYSANSNLHHPFTKLELRKHSPQSRIEVIPLGITLLNPAPNNRAKKGQISNKNRAAPQRRLLEKRGRT